MSDVLTKEQRSYCMSRIRAKNTMPEIALRKSITANGIRGYRLNYKLPGKPDIVFPQLKLAVFVDGCFWHKCPRCFQKPKARSRFWKEKIESNVKRDKAVNMVLKNKGWKVLRIWEHELKNEKAIKRKIIDRIRNTKKRIKVLDLFAGAGGFSLGFDLVRDKNDNRIYEITLAVDNDKYACQTLGKYLKKEYGKDNIVYEADLTDPATHRNIIKKCRNGVDIIIGGPPCQSFSLIGPRTGNGNGTHKKYRIMDKLYIEYLKLVRELKPAFIVFENVKGILSKKDDNNNRYIEIIISDFKKLGYAFDSENDNIKTDYIILNAADYGVPQTRGRVFLIGNRRGLKNPYPPKTHDKDTYITLFKAIGDLPKLKAKITYTGTKNNCDKKKIDRHNKKIYSGEDAVSYHTKIFNAHYKKNDAYGRTFLDFIKPNGCTDPDLTHHIARGQKKDDIILFKGMKQGMIAKDIFDSKSKNIKRLRKMIKYDMSSFRDKYKKQSWNKPCSTVFAHLEKDGNRFIHPDSNQARTITPREAARIQSFPDWYKFEGPYSVKFRQIGNAVPPLLAMTIAKCLVGIMGESK